MRDRPTRRERDLDRRRGDMRALGSARKAVDGVRSVLGTLAFVFAITTLFAPAGLWSWFFGLGTLTLLFGVWHGRRSPFEWSLVAAVLSTLGFGGMLAWMFFAGVPAVGLALCGALVVCGAWWSVAKTQRARALLEANPDLRVSQTIKGADPTRTKGRRVE